MKNKTTRLVAGVCALSLTVGLAGCASTPTTASSASTPESAGSEATSVNAAYMDFDYSEGIDDKGYWEGVTASDYVTLPENWDSMGIPSDVSAVSDEDLQASLDSILAGFESTDSVTDRAVVKDDTVNIDYVGTVDGVEFTGGSTQGNGTDVTAGSEEYVDDFLTQIIGHTPGETIDVTVTFPEGYADSTDAEGNAMVLANKEAVFKTTINYIVESTKPELNDAFVAENLADTYEVSTVDELKTYLSDDLQHSNEYDYILSQLVAESTFADAMPEAVMDYEKSSMLNYYASYADNYGSTLDEFVKSSLGVDSVDALVEEMQESFTESAKQFMALQAVAEAAKLTAGEDEVKNYFGDEDFSSYEEYYGQNYLRLNVLDNLAMDHLLESAVRGGAADVAAEELPEDAEGGVIAEAADVTDATTPAA